MSQITASQAEAFAKALVKAGIIEKGDIEENKNIIEEALRISQSRDGLQKVMYNISDRVGSESTVKPAVSAYNGQVIHGTTHEPLEIFTALYNTKKSEQSQKEKQAQTLIDSALHDWSLYERKVPSNQRYNASIGRNIDKAYFLENPIKCHWQAAGCMARFKTKEDMQRHRYIHGA